MRQIVLRRSLEEASSEIKQQIYDEVLRAQRTNNICRVLLCALMAFCCQLKRFN